MDLKGILSISGHSGLFKLVTHSKNAIIVEHLETKKRMPAYASSKISALEDIAMYTTEEEVPLAEILKKIYEKQGASEITVKPSDKPEMLKNFLADVLPTYDRERVYVSDIKRLITWYNLLLKFDMLKFDQEENTESIEEITQE